MGDAPMMPLGLQRDAARLAAALDAYRDPPTTSAGSRSRRGQPTSLALRQHRNRGRIRSTSPAPRPICCASGQRRALCAWRPTAASPPISFHLRATRACGGSERVVQIRTDRRIGMSPGDARTSVDDLRAGRSPRCRSALCGLARAGGSLATALGGAPDVRSSLPVVSERAAPRTPQPSGPHDETVGRVKG
jgi:hypothetical protein